MSTEYFGEREREESERWIRAASLRVERERENESHSEEDSMELI